MYLNYFVCVQGNDAKLNLEIVSETEHLNVLHFVYLDQLVYANDVCQ